MDYGKKKPLFKEFDGNSIRIHQMKRDHNKNIIKNDMQTMPISAWLFQMYNNISMMIVPFVLYIQSKMQNYITINTITKSNIMNILIIVEIIIMVLHTSLLVRSWIIINFACTLLQMYVKLKYGIIGYNNDNVVRTICDDIKKISTVTIGVGICMLIFFANNVGFITYPFILYGINRTLRNVFNIGI